MSAAPNWKVSGRDEVVDGTSVEDVDVVDVDVVVELDGGSVVEVSGTDEELVDVDVGWVVVVVDVVTSVVEVVVVSSHVPGYVTEPVAVSWPSE